MLLSPSVWRSFFLLRFCVESFFFALVEDFCFLQFVKTAAVGVAFRFGLYP